MAYTHSKHVVTLTNPGTTCDHNYTDVIGCTGGITSGTVAAQWLPGGIPHIVRQCGITYLTSGTTASALQVQFEHLNLTSGSSASTVVTLNGVSSDKIGHVLYKNVTGEVVIKPGQALNFVIKAIITGTCNVRPYAYVEPKWDQPANATAMRAST